MQRTLAGRSLTADESRARLERWCEGWSRHGYGFWIFVDSHGADIGHAGLFESPREPGSIEVGYALKPAYWNRGYATEMTHAVLEAGFAIGLTRIVAIALASNAASRRVMEKTGMTFERDCIYPDGRAGVLYAIARAERIAAAP